MNDQLDELFQNLQGSFDDQEPEDGHQKRFLEKLQKSSVDSELPKTSGLRRLWKPLLGIAASVLLIVSLFLSNNKESREHNLASVSPEMAKTESFFALTIESELKKLNKAEDPDSKELIKDAMLQLSKLEHEYDKLKTDLKASGDDQRVIYAMISNFQNRIDILQNTLEQIELVKQLKSSTNENHTTI